MAQNTQIRTELLREFEVKTMRSDIARLGGDTKIKDTIQPNTKMADTWAPPPPPTPPITKTLPVQKPAEPQPIEKQDTETIQVSERAVERLERLKGEKEAKKLALLEVERLQKERYEAERQMQEIERQKREQAEEIKSEEEKKKTIEEKKVTEGKEREMQILRQKEAERRKILEEKIAEEREAIELKQEAIALQRELQELQEEKRPFEEERNIFLEKERQLTKNIDDIIDRENAIEQEQKNIEEIEKMAENQDDKKTAEEKRWRAEEQRRKIEKERWEWEEELAKAKDQSREIELKYQKIFSREKEIQSKIRIIQERQEAITIEQERETLEKRLQEIRNRKKPFEQERGALLEKQKQVKTRLEEIAQKEIEIEKEQTAIEEEENLAQRPTDKKAAEIKRWSSEEKRRKAEKERWELETETERITKELNRTQSSYQKLLNEEIELERKLGIRKEIEIPIKETQEEAKEEIKENENLEKTAKKSKQDMKATDMERFMEQVKKETAERRNAKHFKIEPESMAPYEPQPPQNEIKEPSTSKEEKEDIQEAIARLRREAKEGRKTERPANNNINQPQEENAKLEPSKKFYETKLTPSPKNYSNLETSSLSDSQNTDDSLKKQESEIKKRLAEIQAEEEKERQKFLGRIQGERKGQENITNTDAPFPSQPEIIRPQAQKQSNANKIFTRVLAFLLVFSIFAGISFFIYWFFFLRVIPEPEIVVQYCEKKQTNIPLNEWSTERCVIPIPEITIPISPISPNKIETFEIASFDEIKIHLSQFLEKDFTAKNIERIVLKDLNQRKIVHLKEFLDIFSSRTPVNFYEKLNPEFYLFVYAQEATEGIIDTKVILVAEIINQEGFLGILRFWEDTMEKDLNNFFVFFGKEGLVANNFFTAATYRSINIRCQTYSTNDTGSCYAVKGNYFVLTSSLQSMQQTIDKLP